MEFRKYLQQCGLSIKDTEDTIMAIKEFETYLKKQKDSLESVSLDGLRDYLLSLNNNRVSEDVPVALARYYRFVGENDNFIYLVGLFGGRNVLPDIEKRLMQIAGADVSDRVFKDFELPLLGAPHEEYAKLTKMIVDNLEHELSSEKCKEVLTWNYHNLPSETYAEKKAKFEKAKSIDEFLREEHQAFIEELSGYMQRGEIWFEQKITPEVLEMVKNNQEIQNGVRKLNKIYVTKIPFAPNQYLTEQDPRMKRFYNCHCPLVRTAIRDGHPKISPLFCYCSAGYEKKPYDVIFGEPVEVEVLESALKGDMRCRFAITIPRNKMK